jgi:murein DD-endopeptidase MepM/ murein hydrolase activator NlpD
MRLAALALIVGAVLATTADPCVGMQLPVDGPVIAGFAPVGRYAGHWGIDVAAPPGTTVRAAAPGRVTFAGTVAGRRSVTVDHGGGIRTSVSYLARVDVPVGSVVAAGDPLGKSGSAHGHDAVHFSVRVDGDYVDPAVWLVCLHSPYRGLRLAPPAVAGASYASPHGARHPRWHLRSTPSCASLRR